MRRAAADMMRAPRAGYRARARLARHIRERALFRRQRASLRFAALFVYSLHAMPLLFTSILFSFCCLMLLLPLSC